jgi:hypothetical protein
LTTHGSAPNETGLAKNPEVLGDLRLGDRNLVDNRADWHLAAD